MPPVVIKWVLLQDEQTAKEPPVLLSTKTELSEEQIICCFIRRWSMEGTFEQSTLGYGKRKGSGQTKLSTVPPHH